MDDSLAARLHRALLFVAYRTIRVYWRVLRPRTSGACVVVWSGDAVLLVRHSYKRGLGFPAGGLGRSESALEAAVRELREEVGIRVSPGELRHSGHRVSREYGNEDHLDFFELRQEPAPEVRVDGREIVWAGFTPLAEALAQDLLPAARRWLEENRPPPA